MKKTFFPIILIITFFYSCLTTPVYTGQNENDAEYSFQVGQFSIPTNAELLESTEFKDNGITYLLEQRYRLQSGQIMYAYYDIEGSNSVTIQKMEENPLLTIGTDVNIPGMPGYREFNFGDDRRKLVQFMKLFKLGRKDYSGRVKTPSLGDSIFTPSGVYSNKFILLFDLYDETWALEHQKLDGQRIASADTTALVRVNKYSE